MFGVFTSPASAPEAGGPAFSQKNSICSSSFGSPKRTPMPIKLNDLEARLKSDESIQVATHIHLSIQISIDRRSNTCYLEPPPEKPWDARWQAVHLISGVHPAMNTF
jgi:hypothetical protein